MVEISCNLRFAQRIMHCRPNSGKLCRITGQCPKTSVCGQAGWVELCQLESVSYERGTRGVLGQCPYRKRDPARTPLKSATSKKKSRASPRASSCLIRFPKSAVSFEIVPLGLPSGEKIHRARCPAREPHFKRRFMINQARQTLCLGQTDASFIYMRLPHMTRPLSHAPKGSFKLFASATTSRFPPTSSPWFLESPARQRGTRRSKRLRRAEKHQKQ